MIEKYEEDARSLFRDIFQRITGLSGDIENAFMNEQMDNLKTKFDKALPTEENGSTSATESETSVIQLSTHSKTSATQSSATHSKTPATQSKPSATHSKTLATHPSATHSKNSATKSKHSKSK